MIYESRTGRFSWTYENGFLQVQLMNGSIRKTDQQKMSAEFTLFAS
jgi:hypothetical protein